MPTKKENQLVHFDINNMDNGYYWIQKEKRRAEVGFYHRESDTFLTVGSVVRHSRELYTVHCKIDVSAFKSNPYSRPNYRLSDRMNLSEPQSKILKCFETYPDAYLIRRRQFDLQPMVVPNDPDIKLGFSHKAVLALIRRGILVEFEPNHFKLSNNLDQP